MNRRLRITLLSLAVVAVLAAPAWAQKSDIVTLTNGDKITCTVRLLDRGRLRVDTDDLGTVYIEWLKIVSVTTKTTFRIETSSGLRLLGRLGQGPPGSLAVVADTGTVAVDMPIVVYAAPIGISFWNKLDGAFDTGMSYTQSSGVGQVNVNSTVTYRRPNVTLQLTGASYFTAQTDEDDTSRHTVQFASSRSILTKSLWMLIGGVDRNQELGYDLRSTFSGAFGHYLARSNRAVVIVAGGLSVNEELPVEGEGVENLDALISLRQSYFTYDFPRTSTTLSVEAYPGLSQWGRLRLESNFSIRREIVHDFTVGLTAYDSYDNQPPTAEARKNDFGVTFTVGWVF
jgi:hypothetical protein